MSKTTIQIESKTRDELKRIRCYPRETYDETIRRLIEIMKGKKSEN